MTTPTLAPTFTQFISLRLFSVSIIAALFVQEGCWVGCGAKKGFAELLFQGMSVIMLFGSPTSDLSQVRWVHVVHQWLHGSRPDESRVSAGEDTGVTG